MEKETVTKTDTGKMEYQKPKLRKIELVADEVLALGCKNDSASYTGAPPCLGVCFTWGS